MRKFVWLGTLGVILSLALNSGIQAQDVTYFTIGTGSTAYTYYPLGGTIANAVSKPPKSRSCEDGGSCGVDGLVAVAVSSRGSVDNINAILSGKRDSGFSQSDVAYWAYTGTGIMDGQKPARKLRLITALYPEHIHLVTLADSPIKSVLDLKGKRVSLDEEGSGAYVDAKLVLQANGLTKKDIHASHFKGDAAANALLSGKIDAFFVIAGYPVQLLVDLAERIKIKLIPIDGQAAVDLPIDYNFFANDIIPADTYKSVGTTPTIAVGAQWVTSADKDEELIYKITKSLWHKTNRYLLDMGHAKGKFVTLETALNGLGLPLHPGALRYYKEVGMIK